MGYAGIIKNSIIIGCLIGSVWWYNLQNRPFAHVTQQSKPQEYMANLTIINYGDNGEPRQKLQAVYWAFVPNNARSDLQQPHVIIYKPNGDVWHLSAYKAIAWHTKLGEKITQLDMLENVLVERTAENNATPTKITTQTMRYLAQNKQLSSEDYVYMHQPGLTISGKGMLGYLDKNWIELHDHITTVYNAHAG